MGILDLKRIEVVELFSINEMQKVTEHDSPCIGAMTDIAERISLYEFFHSHRQAHDYVENLRANYKSKNKSLRLNENGLVGEVNHNYSHYFEIKHKMSPHLINFLKLFCSNNATSFL